MRSFKRILPSALISILALSGVAPVVAQDDGEAQQEIEEVIVIGTRSTVPRSAADSTAPIDFINGSDMDALGNTADITDGLRALVPYFNASMASGDGDTFVRPTSLRGLAPDQSLVMLNGKRRHRAALIAEFVPAAGKGAHGPNIGMIPSIAIKNVQILRDGASAQYGSDAISGVVNFQMKDASEGGMVRAQYGRYLEGETSFKVDANVGLQLGYDGFVNLSIERVYNEALSRGKQRPAGQALIDAGVDNVGADSPFDDSPYVQTWGRPRSDGLRLFANGAVPVSDNTEAYFQGNLADVMGRYRFFFRAPNHATLNALAELGFTGLPQGFTPYFDGQNNDYSIASGWRGTLSNGLFFDYSVSMGNDSLDFTLNNTINQSIGLNSMGEPLQRDFDVGALEQTEWAANADFAKQLSDRVHLGFGGEWRKEEFGIKAGEPVSYEGAGSSGFKGFEPQNAGRFSRNNLAAYSEIELEMGDVLTQYAARYEGYSDFGGTVNGKFAFRWSVSPMFTARGAFSTGFHAPTPGQSNIQKITTTFDANVGGQVEQGLVPPDHGLAQAAGGTALTQETSQNYSLGFTSNIDDMLQDAELTFDIYRIDVQDRIYKTQTIPVIDPNTNIGTNVSFYTNALDVVSKGFDVVMTWPVVIKEVTNDLSLAISYNSVEVADQNTINGIRPVGEADIEDIENSYPDLRFVASSTTHISDYASLNIRANYYGSHFDERGRIGGNPPTKELGSTVFVDAELSIDVSDAFTLNLGVVNLFDTYVDEIDDPYANRQSVGLPYARRTAANFEGGSYYFTVAYSF